MDTTFPRTYEIEELTEYPITSLPRYYYPGATRESGGDGLILRVRPALGTPWWGTFAPGWKGFVDGIYTTPNPDRFCVVYWGSGYLVSAEDPTCWEPIRAFPIRDVRPVQQASLIFADDTRLYAYGEAGLLRRTEGLVDDELRITEVTDTAILGTGDYHGREGARFWVGLETGAWGTLNPKR